MESHLDFEEGRYFEYNTKRTHGAARVLEECVMRLKLIADLTEHCICPVCGAPDCGNELILWAQFADEKLAVIMGGDTFGSFLSRWHYEGINADDYQKLPEFIKQDNECTGWRSIHAPINKEIDAADFLRSLEVVKNSEYTLPGDEFLEIYYPVLKQFADAVISKDLTLNVLD
ncbi:hypothetical protein [Mucilaginibacter pedocola]|uniref:Uncharacterized protein n=1 Tax=Mucilaginibacter pedocola TaxID=1792845 RepID=A0A1S9PGT0_9SPHI|nr:hypothetical protein [Mucilaginibacter pedocola]OOQ60166.1 hypothetical protein BC343_26975 [Mucilaginibacter pedocola]